MLQGGTNLKRRTQRLVITFSLLATLVTPRPIDEAFHISLTPCHHPALPHPIVNYHALILDRLLTFLVAFLLSS